MNRLQLLDLSPVWLGSMVLAVKPTRDMKALSMTCSKLRQLMFSQSAICPRLIVKHDDFDQLTQPPHFQALAMAEAAATRLCLELEDNGTPLSTATCASRAFLSLLLRSALAFHQLQQPQQPPAPVSLRCISTVSLSKCILDSFLPDVLVQHCPNLLELRIHNVDIAAEYATPQLICTSLQKLTLSWVESMAPDEFKQQLLNHLPNLTTLDLWHTGDRADYETDALLWAAISRYSSQLKALRCNPAYDLVLGVPWSVNTQLPLLQELDLEFTLSEDAHMQQLLQSAPGLKRLSVDAIKGLTGSFAQVPCSWQELKLHQLYLPELAKLPLSSCTRLECLDCLLMRDPDLPEPSLEQITAAVVTAQAAGGLHLNQRIVQLVLSPDDLERFTAATPLLQHIPENLSLSFAPHGAFNVQPPWSDYRPQLAVLGQLTKCHLLQFYWRGWADNPGAAAQLPELLPHAKEFVFHHSPPEADLVQIVRTATRQLTLRLKHSDFVPDVPLQLLEELQQAVQEAGHGLVNLVDD